MTEKILVFIWVLDSLFKVFPTTLPPENTNNTIQLSCAANEWESSQIAIRSEMPIQELRVQAGELKNEKSNKVLPAQNIRCNFIGFIPIEHNTRQTPGDEIICEAPAKVPDVLLPDESLSLPANHTQPVWITIHVPKNTPPGMYKGEVIIQADETHKTIPIELNIYDFELPEARHLLVTNWFNANNIAEAHEKELYSDEFFNVLEAYAHNMAEHRENVFLVSPRTINVFREKDGNLTYDYSTFDRFVETFLNAGVKDRIEISHVAHHGEGGWSSKEIMLSEISAKDRETGKSIKLPPEEGLGPLLSDLQTHLTEKGWLSRSMIHVCDEPAAHNIDQWHKASEFVHHYAPLIKRIDAIETIYFHNALEIWVPKLNHLRNWYPWFKNAQQEGYEMWYYICLHPRGPFLNRFLDYPLYQTRLLHWLNYRYELDGYLHWGWNFWRDDPFGPPAKRLPPGDTHIIYPGDNGPLNSIRWETQRDSIEDYEYLWLLTQKRKEVAIQLGSAAERFDPKARSLELSRRMIPDFVNYERDIESIRHLRETVAAEIEQSLNEPLIIWETIPAEDVNLIPAPISVEVRGVTRQGAKTKMNGENIPVQSNGFFKTQVHPSAKNNTVSLDVDYNGEHKHLERTFHVRTEFEQNN